ncbi:MAG: hypothetical protein GYB68_04740 [Chloroflexi bacterium]|nr:hypothetical protein [Chloroflexota bacterium]
MSSNSNLPSTERRGSSLSGRSPEERTGMLRGLFNNVALSWRLFWDGRVPLLLKSLPLIGGAYLIWPLDIITEAAVVVFGPGVILDDIGILTAALLLFVRMAPPDVVREHLRELGAVLPERLRQDEPADEGDMVEGDVVDGDVVDERPPDSYYEYRDSN